MPTRYYYVKDLKMEVINAQSDGFIPQGPFTAKGDSAFNCKYWVLTLYILDASRAAKAGAATVGGGQAGGSRAGHQDTAAGKVFHTFSEDGKFDCSICPKKYKHYGRLRSHVETKHSSRLYIKSGVCGQDTFIDVAAFNRHTKGKQRQF